jgi:hypothetical protein
MIFAKSLLGGVIAVIAMWAIILMIFMLRIRAETREQGTTGLVAVAGGWNYLLQKPSVILLLTAAFGIGLYVTARLSR